MNIDFFGNDVRAETNGLLVCLNDLFNAGNAWRLSNGKPALQLASFLSSVGLNDYLKAASKEWNISEDGLLYKTGIGKKTRTMCHVSVALLAAELISPEFHAKSHRVLIEGKLLEFREYGGTEFKALNVSIDLYLPEREGKDNKGVYIQCAKRLREKILGGGKVTDDWNNATVAETHKRYDCEKRLTDYLKMGFVKNFDHLKELIEII